MKSTTLKPLVNQDQTFPFVKWFNDYHDVATFRAKLMRKYGDRSASTAEHAICYKELGCDGKYWALFFLEGEEPTAAETKKLLRKTGEWIGWRK